MKRDYIEVVVELKKTTDEFNNVKLVEVKRQVPVTKYNHSYDNYSLGGEMEGEYPQQELKLQVKKGYINAAQEFYYQDTRFRIDSLSENDNLNDFIIAREVLNDKSNE